MNDAALPFAEAGLLIPYPEDDLLFIEDHVYRHGLLEEYSIVANYSRIPAQKRCGFKACDALALDRGVPQATRELARSNLKFYVEPLAASAPSFRAKPIDFVPPDGYRATNPSIARRFGQQWAIQRTVNYVVHEDPLRYEIPEISPDAPLGVIRTRNFLLELGDDMAVTASREIEWERPPAVYPHVQGLEDMRLIVVDGSLRATATVRELNEEGWCEQVYGRIDDSDPTGPCRFVDWRVLQPTGERRHQKNWMPLVQNGIVRFVYGCDPVRILNDDGDTIWEQPSVIAADQFRGGSQLVAFLDGWLAIVHEALMAGGRRFYHHRFVFFDRDWRMTRCSRPFYFQHKGIEFAAGLSWRPGYRYLAVSYGVRDAESWVALVSANEIRDMLTDL